MKQTFISQRQRLTEVMSRPMKTVRIMQQVWSIRVSIIISMNKRMCTQRRKINLILVVWSFSSSDRLMRMQRQQALMSRRKFTIIANIIFRFINIIIKELDQQVLPNYSQSLISSSSKLREVWSNFYKIGFTIFVAFRYRTYYFLLPPVSERFYFSYPQSTLFLIGVTLLFLFFIINGCPSNCQILHISSLLTFRTAAKLLNSPQQLGAEKRVTNFLSQINSQPSQTTWWERQMRSNSCLLRKQSITFLPQQKLIPLSKFSLQPSVLGFGSDHRISATIRLQPGSTGLLMLLMQDTCLMSGLSPPCTQKMRSDTTAATGQKLKLSDIIFHVLMLSLLLHSSQKPQSLLSQLDQWLPLRKKKLLGHLILQAMSRQIHSRDCLPLSTQSPKNRQLFLVGSPNSLKIVSRSLNWPCVSPQI